MHAIQAATIGPLKPPQELVQRMGAIGAEPSSPVEDAEAVRDAFTEFIGKTFFGQMLKAMRKSTSKPAYFHGGQAEEIFRSQLDEALADEMTTASASQFADPLFERQFPRQAAVLKEQASGGQPANPSLGDLAALRRT